MIYITVKLSAGTFVAKISGTKTTASSTISARQAAEALAIKLGHSPFQINAEGEDDKGVIRYSIEQPSYDTLVLKNMGASIPSEVTIGDRKTTVSAWSKGHALNEKNMLEDFIRSLSFGNIEDPQAAASELMDRMGWA